MLNDANVDEYGSFKMNCLVGYQKMLEVTQQ